jgi:hypothetical protein
MTRILSPIVRHAAVFLGLSTLVVAIPVAAGHAGQRLYDMGLMFNRPHPFESAPYAQNSSQPSPAVDPNRVFVDGRYRYGMGATTSGAETVVERRDALGSPRSFEDPKVAAAPPNVHLAISGHVHRALLYIDDGDDDGSDQDKSFFNVDSNNSATRLRFLARGQLDEHRAIGSNIVLQFQSNATGDISQRDSSSTEDFVGTRNLEVWFSHTGYGKVWMGKGHTASDGATERDLSGTGVAAYSGVGDIAAGIEFRAPGGGLSGNSIGSIFNNLDGLGRDNRLRYDTPSFRGANLALSLVDGGDWDAALIYSQKLPKRGLALVAAAHYADATSARGYDQVGGSVSVREESSGLSLTGALGLRDQSDGTERTFGYVKLGWQAEFFRFGRSVMSIDIFTTQDAIAEGDDGLSAGYFIVQRFRETGTELYGGFRWYDYESTIKFQDIVAITTGVRQKF